MRIYFTTGVLGAFLLGTLSFKCWSATTTACAGGGDICPPPPSVRTPTPPPSHGGSGCAPGSATCALPPLPKNPSSRSVPDGSSAGSTESGNVSDDSDTTDASGSLRSQLSGGVASLSSVPCFIGGIVRNITGAPRIEGLRVVGTDFTDMGGILMAHPTAFAQYTSILIQLTQELLNPDMRPTTTRRIIESLSKIPSTDLPSVQAQMPQIRSLIKVDDRGLTLSYAMDILSKIRTREELEIFVQQLQRMKKLDPSVFTNVRAYETLNRLSTAMSGLTPSQGAVIMTTISPLLEKSTDKIEVVCLFFEMPRTHMMAIKTQAARFIMTREDRILGPIIKSMSTNFVEHIDQVTTETLKFRHRKTSNTDIATIWEALAKVPPAHLVHVAHYTKQMTHPGMPSKDISLMVLHIEKIISTLHASALAQRAVTTEMDDITTQFKRLAPHINIATYGPAILEVASLTKFKLNAATGKDITRGEVITKAIALIQNRVALGEATKHLADLYKELTALRADISQKTNKLGALIEDAKTAEKQRSEAEAEVTRLTTDEGSRHVTAAIIAERENIRAAEKLARLTLEANAAVLEESLGSRIAQYKAADAAVEAEIKKIRERIDVIDDLLATHLATQAKNFETAEAEGKDTKSLQAGLLENTSPLHKEIADFYVLQDELFKKLSEEKRIKDSLQLLQQEYDRQSLKIKTKLAAATEALEKGLRGAVSPFQQAEQALEEKSREVINAKEKVVQLETELEEPAKRLQELLPPIEKTERLQQLTNQALRLLDHLRTSEVLLGRGPAKIKYIFADDETYMPSVSAAYSKTKRAADRPTTPPATAPVYTPIPPAAPPRTPAEELEHRKAALENTIAWEEVAEGAPWSEERKQAARRTLQAEWDRKYSQPSRLMKLSDY
jgi:hypothetical protein